MPRACARHSFRIDPEMYEARLVLKQGDMIFSDIIARMLQEIYGWSENFPANKSDMADFGEINTR